MNKHLELFLTFSKIGVITFGGGYAMLPALTREAVNKKGWATEEELMDYYAIGQCTPGVIAVNTATFIGKKIGGILGAISATLGVVFPSLIIILLLASFISRFAEYETVKHAFAGIRIAVCALVTVSAAKLIKKAVVDIAAVLILTVTFLAMLFLDISPVLVILLSALIAIVIKAVAQKCKGAGN